MGFAADAVMEVVPPPRQAARAPADTSGPSFDDHLNASNQAEPAPESGRAVRADTNTDRTTDDNAEPEDDAQAPVEAAQVPVTPTPQPAAPIMLQLIDLAGALIAPPPQAPTGDTAAPPPPTVGAAAQNAAQTPPSLIPRPAMPPPSEETQSAETADASDVDAAGAPKATENAAHTEGAPAAPVQAVQQPAPVTQPVATQQAQATSAAPPTTLAPPQSIAATVQTAAAAPPPRPAAAPVAQTGKAETTRGDAKAEAAAAKALENGTAPKPQQAGSASNVAATVIDAPVLAINAADTSSGQTQAHLQATASTAAAHTQQAVLDQNVTRAAPVAAQVAREIVRRFDGENTRFELRLDPPELGRIEVRLEVSRDHRVTAVVSADSPQALSELARHARELEQTLQSAGLQLNDNGLSFDLRQSRDDGAEGERTGGARGADGDETLTETPATARPIGFERWRGVRVDLMI